MHSDWLKSQVTCNIQSECLISAWHSYVNQKFVYDRFDALSQKKGSFDFINLNKEIILKQTIFGLWRQLIGKGQNLLSVTSMQITKDHF